MHDCFTLSVNQLCTESESEKRLFLYAYDEVFEPGFLFVLICFALLFSFCYALAHSIVRSLDIHLLVSRFLRKKMTEEYFFYSETLCILINPTHRALEFLGIMITNRRGNKHNRNAQNSCTEYIPLSYRKQ